jgi:hypothetical protein
MDAPNVESPHKSRLGDHLLPGSDVLHEGKNSHFLRSSNTSGQKANVWLSATVKSNPLGFLFAFHNTGPPKQERAKSHQERNH